MQSCPKALFLTGHHFIPLASGDTDLAEDREIGTRNTRNQAEEDGFIVRATGAWWGQAFKQGGAGSDLKVGKFSLTGRWVGGSLVVGLVA